MIVIRALEGSTFHGWFVNLGKYEVLHGDSVSVARLELSKRFGGIIIFPGHIQVHPGEELILYPLGNLGIAFEVFGKK
jgi:hypothetical protein